MSGVTKRQETVALEKALMILGKRIRLQHLYRGLLQLAYTGLAALFVFFLIDWLTKMPYPIRILILLGGIGYGAFWFIRGPLARSRKPFDPEEIGLLVERQFPELHSRMISTLQLQAKDELSDEVSEDLVEGMLDQTFDQLPNIKMDALVDTDWMKRGGKYLAVAVALILASAVIGRGYFASFIQRLVIPSIEYPTNTLIQEVDTPALIPIDSPFEMQVLAGGTIPSQGSVTIETTDGFKTEVDLFPVKGEEGKFVAEVPGLLRKASYVISLGDATYGPKTITPMPRPNIESMTTVVTAPDYTGEEPATLLTGNAKAIIGSEFDLTIRPSQDLKELKLVSEKHQALMPEMSKQADGSWVGTMSPTNSLAYTITMVSAQGLESDKLPRYRVSIVPDRAPKIRVMKPSITSDAAPVSKLPMEFTVRDDYGLGSVKIYYAVGATSSAAGADGESAA